ncbi:MAG TPA: N(G),N(G)-dimethylarginine dimethylaminohydrolase [Vicinamibacterales bacterium]|jgi:dimethylargininase|nr:N(G),N(G)-dimethylarginine dimethylaminohydrolase [Vicinamibacterales bacterium]
MEPLIAITRAVSDALSNCELTHLSRVPIDVARAREQHEAYEAALAELGCRVMQLSSADNTPDSVFIEDTAVVLDELAVICRPGAASRRSEVDVVSGMLWPFRRTFAIEAPGTIDGGDVLVAGRTIFVGRSSRTNDAGIAQLEALCAPAGYIVQPVGVRGCLHLKSAATAISERELLVNPEWIDTMPLRRYDIVEVAKGEDGAANVARVGDRLLAAAAFPRTNARIEERGHQVMTVDVSELAKAEGAVTCCSLIFTPPTPIATAWGH